MSSSGSSSKDWISKVSRVRESELTATIEKLLLLPIVAFALQVANALEAIFNVFIVPISALIDGIAQFIGSLFGGIARVLSAGAAGTAQNVQQWFILSFPVAVAVVVPVAMILAWYTDQDYTSDLIPFTSTDVPFVGNDEED